jgi:hypothetical protein
VVASGAGRELAFVVQFERGEARITGRHDPLILDFRVTMVFRWEDGAWKPSTGTPTISPGSRGPRDLDGDATLR